jgi:Flp pilus assembly protein TadD
VRAASTRWTPALGTVALFLLGGCAAAPRPAPQAPPARKPAPVVARPQPTPRLSEEDLARRENRNIGRTAEDQGPSTSEAAADEAPTLLASIGPSTPPERAASIRLTDSGRKLLESGDAQGALDRIESAVKLDPTNPHAYYWLAQVHWQNGRLDQTLSYSEKAIVLFAPSERQAQSEAYTLRGRVLEQVGRFPDARQAYRRALSVQPGNVAARAGLARIGDEETTAP